MNKDDLKKALTEKGIPFTDEMTNKQLTKLLNGAAPEETPAAGTTDQDDTEAPAFDADKWAAEQIKEAKPADAPKGITEEAIAEKVKAGLRREQAIEVLQSQAAHDAALAAAEKNKGKA